MAINTLNIADKPTLDDMNSALTTAGSYSSTLTTKLNQLSTAVSAVKTDAQSLKTKAESLSDNISDALSTVGYNIIVKDLPENTNVSATKGSITLTGTSDENEICVFQVPEIGTWTITATSGTRTVQTTVYVGKLDSQTTVFLEIFSATLNVTTEPCATVTATTMSGITYSSTADLSGNASLTINHSGIYNVSATINGSNSPSSNINIIEDGGLYITPFLPFRKLIVLSDKRYNVTIVNGNTTLSFTSSGSDQTVYIPNDGTWTVTATLDQSTITDTVNINSFSTYTAYVAETHIYGIEWAGGSDPSCTRTDDSALFSDPDPYMADGSHPGSSPFDTLMPWSGMVKETIGEDVFVKIPKFWFKITKDGTKRKIQIADKAASGFFVSPAHQDRGDGNGERDYVYVSRYHVNNAYKSKSGIIPLGDITRATARSGCAGRGTGYCQFDIMTLITIWYLYLVEFAHWNSQLKIGDGCGNNSSKENTGASDSMPYHTGTMQTSRTTYGVGCQYRWIEDLWGNVHDWVDGIYFSDTNIYVIKNPANFSDSSGGTDVGFTRAASSSEIKAWGNSSVSGYEWFMYPTEVYSDSSYTTYCCDHVFYHSNSPVMFFGARYNRFQSAGIFCINSTFLVSGSNDYLGARLLYLP